MRTSNHLKARAYSFIATTAAPKYHNFRCIQTCTDACAVLPLFVFVRAHSSFPRWGCNPLGHFVGPSHLFGTLGRKPSAPTIASPRIAGLWRGIIREPVIVRFVDPAICLPPCLFLSSSSRTSTSTSTSHTVRSDNTAPSLPAKVSVRFCRREVTVALPAQARSGTFSFPRKRC